MKRDTGLLGEFLVEVRRETGPRPWRMAVEFRNTDWLTSAVNEVLNQHGAALCLADMPMCPATEANDAPFVYLRRHGPGGRYRGCYAERHIADDAARITAWLDEGRDVYVYFNNDLEGYAVDNARGLMAALSSD
jgi:uncharacterized protein YecE (DUF72 family)